MKHHVAAFVSSSLVMIQRFAHEIVCDSLRAVLLFSSAGNLHIDHHSRTEGMLW